LTCLLIGNYPFLNDFDAASTTCFEYLIKSVPCCKSCSLEGFLANIGLSVLVEFCKPQFDEHAKLTEESDEQVERSIINGSWALILPCLWFIYLSTSIHFSRSFMIFMRNNFMRQLN
jgi:hypothetical protein